MRIDEFDFDLPDELIAREPAALRDGSRLIHMDGRSGRLTQTVFSRFLELVDPKDLIVFNDTRVIKARLRGQKASGGVIEVLVERILDDRVALAHVRASKSPQMGSEVVLAGEIRALITERQGSLFRLEFGGGQSVLEVLDRYGEVPLPPYIDRPANATDQTRYQTVYAKKPGAVAAPTAGLHFDEEALAAMDAKGIKKAFVTLHVGAGSFQPVRELNVADHVMHEEWFEVPDATVAAIAECRATGGRILAVGTTTLRALESAAAGGQIAKAHGDTKLFVLPGYRFRVVDRLLTNFHLPKSTLLMLVSAFGGIENIRRAYAFAIKERFRFYSYGDAMLIERKD